MNLLVLGNGSDLALNVPTSPKNCNDWLNNAAIKNVTLKKKLNNIYIHYNRSNLFTGHFWGDVEDNIPLISYPPKDTNISAPRWYNINIWMDIHKCFGLWVNHICQYVDNNYTHIGKEHSTEFHFIKDLAYKSNKILNFNYTQTLELCFQIPSKNIIHIHGCGVDDYHVLGHGGSIKAINSDSDLSFLLDKRRWKNIRKLKRITYNHYRNIYFNGTLKNTKQCFFNHLKQFLHINDKIKKLTFLGLSYSPTDWNYFHYMKRYKLFDNHCIGVFYYHSEKSLNAAKKFCAYLHNTLHIIQNSPDNDVYFKLDK